MASKSTKKDLVQHIAKALEVSPVEAERVMLVVMRYVRRQLLEDTSVILPGIGTPGTLLLLLAIGALIDRWP